MTPESYAKIVRAGAIYDIVATAALAIPPMAYIVLQIVQWLDLQLGFGTEFLPVDPTSMFFLNLAGCFVIVWAVAKLRNPTPEMGRLDALLRFALVALQLWNVAQGATPILLGIGAVLLIIGILELRQPAPELPRATTPVTSS